VITYTCKYSSEHLIPIFSKTGKLLKKGATPVKNNQCEKGVKSKRNGCDGIG